MRLRDFAVLTSTTLVIAISAMPSAAAGGNSAATITGSFADSCRDFAAHSTKDISHVEIRYADGRVVKDERTTKPDYAIDGGPGGEISIVIVKSGTTSTTFTCPRASSPPTALLEALTPSADCFPFFESGLLCLQWVPRTVWRSRSDFPTAPDPSTGLSNEAGNLLWGCDQTAGVCSSTFDFRGTGSSDPDGDITSWSLDFGDGSSTSGSWTGDPPADVSHTYGPGPFPSCADPDHICVTLTVTDAAGHSDSDTITMGFINGTPD